MAEYFTKVTIGNFICVPIKYSLGYGFKIYYKQVKRGKDVARNFIYFIKLHDCLVAMYEQLSNLKTLEEINGNVTLEMWYNSYHQK